MVPSSVSWTPSKAPEQDADGASLDVLFDVGHPAHVHLFRNAIEELQERGHSTFVTSREKEVTVDLLEAYGIDHTPLSTRGNSTAALVGEQFLRELRLLAVARRFRPDVIVGRLGPAPAHVSAVLGSRYVAVSDTHIDQALLRRVYGGITYPFVDTICAPESFQLPVPDERRRPLDFQELAYLHPRYFDPDPTALEPLDLTPEDRYFVIRLAGWDAYHDVGYDGLSPTGVQRLVDMLGQHGAVFISAENELPPNLASHRLRTPPESVHHVLYYADLYVGDSGTMSTEAAMLGTPAIRTNTMVGEEDENVFVELEERYGLLRSYADEDDAIDAVESVMASGIDRLNVERRRQRLVEGQPDVTKRLVETILESASRTLEQQ